MPSAVAGEIRSLAAGPLNWDLLLSDAACHPLRLSSPSNSLLWRATSLSAARLKQLKDLARAAVVRSLAFTAELVAILNLFRSEGLQAIPYKGPVLAEQATETSPCANLRTSTLFCARKTCLKRTA